MSFQKSILQWCLERFGRAFHTHDPAPSAAHVIEKDQPDQATHWALTNVSLKPGWYMLEIEHSLDSIGCVLSLNVGAGEQQFLQLTSKQVCKRIVHLTIPLTRFTVSIDQPRCTLARLSLVAMTSSFATKRMQNRLQGRGYRHFNKTVDLATLYSHYQTLVHDAVVDRPYAPDESHGTEKSLVHAGDNATAIQLLLHAQQNRHPAELDPSITAAIEFARQLGWTISLTRNNENHSDRETDSLKSRVFHLWLDHSARYTAETFHLLLSAVSEDTVLVYADHDYVDSKGIRSNPVLKPAWNPELLLNTNYIQLPWMVADEWYQQLEAVEGAFVEQPERVLITAALGVTQSGDAVLPALSDNQVERITTVLASLYVNQLTSDDGTSDDISDGKPILWQQLVLHALSVSESEATVSRGICPEFTRVHWTLPMQQPTVDIIVPTRDMVSVLQPCIDSVLQKTSYTNYRILIVDNNSVQAETALFYQTLTNDSRCSIYHYAGAFNYSAINNFAVSKSTADVLVLLNNDTEVISPDWLEELVSHAMRPEVGCVGAKLYYSNGRVQHGGVIVGINGVAGHAHRYSPRHARGYCNRLITSQNLSAVTAACLAVRRTTFLEVGGLDEEHLQVAWNDVDLCLKVRALGYRNVWTPHAQLFHHEGLSRGADDTRNKIQRVDRERRVMTERWDLDNFNDPAYHPQLTKSDESFGLGS